TFMSVHPSAIKQRINSGTGRDWHPPFEGLNESICLTLDFKDLYCLVRRACRQPAAVIVQSGVVLNSRKASVGPRTRTSCSIHRVGWNIGNSFITYNHIIVTRIGDNLSGGL